jgi:N-acetylmuramoyl-L-alanine amidase
MLKRIVLQASHENINNNSIVALHGHTGAPNELTFNIDIRNQVAAELRSRGVEVITTDANANDDKTITNQDWDLFLAINYDADIYGMGGYFCDFPEPSTDGATVKSQAITKAISTEYGKVTGIVNHPERSNANTRYYYMWKFLSAKTPCSLIECGVGMHVPDDWQILHFDRPRVVEGITRGICVGLGLNYDKTTTTTTVTTTSMSTSSSTTTILPVNQCEIKLRAAKKILWGKGWPWDKINKLKVLLPSE